MGRRSTSSDVSSTLSEATTVQSYTKDPSVAKADDAKPEAKASVTTTKPERRGLRQKARDVLSDMGSPPTTRHDAKDGKPTKNYADLGLLGSVVTAKAGHI